MAEEAVTVRKRRRLSRMLETYGAEFKTESPWPRGRWTREMERPAPALNRERFEYREVRPGLRGIVARVDLEYPRMAALDYYPGRLRRSTFAYTRMEKAHRLDDYAISTLSRMWELRLTAAELKSCKEELSNITPLINHSNTPNCAFYPLSRTEVLFYTLGPIAAGEELTVHYGDNYLCDAYKETRAEWALAALMEGGNKKKIAEALASKQPPPRVPPPPPEDEDEFPEPPTP